MRKELTYWTQTCVDENKILWLSMKSRKEYSKVTSEIQEDLFD